MLHKAGLVLQVRAYGNIESIMKCFKCLGIKDKALFKAAEGEAISFFIKSIGAAKEAAGGKGPAIVVISSGEESLLPQVFISDVVIDDSNRSFASYVFIVFEGIVLGVGNNNLNLTGMVVKDLISVFNKEVGLLGIAGNSAYSNRKFNPEVKLYRSGEHGIIAEDLFLLIRVLEITPYADLGIGIFGEFGAADSD